jgi:hypothetical protein
MTFRITTVYTIGLFAGLLAATSLRAQPVGAQPPSIVGSWRTTINQGPGRPALQSLHTFTIDGGFLGTYAVPVTTQPQTNGTGTEAHGAWVRIGASRFAYHAVGLEIDPQGRFGGLFEVSATVTVAPGGKTARGQETFTIGAPTGQVIVAGRATFTSRRVGA